MGLFRTYLRKFLGLVKRVLIFLSQKLYCGERSLGEGIVVVRLDEIGDAVLMTPFLRELRRNYPIRDITLVVKPAVKNLVELCPYVDRVIVYSYPKGRLAFLKNWYTAYCFSKKHLRPLEIGVAIVPRWDSDAWYGAGWLALFSGASKRVGYSSCVSEEKQRLDKGYDGFYTETIKDSTFLQHEVLRNLDVLKYIGCKVESDKLELWLSEDDFKVVDAVGINERALNIALFLSAGSKKREFGLAAYAVVATKLKEKYKNLEVWLLGDVQNTNQYAIEFMRYYPDAHNLVGKTTLRQTAAFLSRCDLYLGGDTGPMHMAAAVGCKGVALFVASAAWQKSGLNAPERFGPWGGNIIPITPNKPMNGCENGCCKNYAHCIKQIAPDLVVKKLADVIGNDVWNAF